MNSCCKNCTQETGRRPGCHDTCVKYFADTMIESIQKGKVDREIVSYEIYRTERLRDRKLRKGKKYIKYGQL